MCTVVWTAGPYPAPHPWAGSGAVMPRGHLSYPYPGGFGSPPALKQPILLKGWVQGPSFHVRVGLGWLRADVTLSCGPAEGHLGKTGICESLLIIHRCCICMRVWFSFGTLWMLPQHGKEGIIFNQEIASFPASPGCYQFVFYWQATKHFIKEIPGSPW